MLEKMKAYWESEECVKKEYRECSTEKLDELIAANEKCLVAMVENPDIKNYESWRLKNGFSSVSRKYMDVAAIQANTIYFLRLLREVRKERT